MQSRLLALGLVGGLAAGLSAACPALAQPINLKAVSAGIAFQWPIACEPDRSCWIQSYVDRDPGPGARDYRCGTQTYEAHSGIDIRLPSLVEMRRGVAVKAAAPGRVRALRDGVMDISIKDPANPHIPNQDCGNAVVVDHAGGWSTTYCHMKRGSVAVKKGQEVATGQVLGQVGLSGNTEFPHLHFRVQHDGADADPFAPAAAPGSCNTGGGSLWAPAVAAKLAYRGPSLIVTGFANDRMTAELIDSGGAAAPTRKTPIVAYVRVINLAKGDVRELTLTAPNGKVLATNAAPALAQARAQEFVFAGDRPPPMGWAPGTYKATYTVKRGGRPVLQRSWSLVLG